MLCAIAALASVPLFSAKHKEKPQVILDTAHPKDSRGETVYKVRGPADKDQPVVPGVLILPTVVDTPAPRYTPSSQQASVPLHVGVDGVVTENGDFIDATVSQDNGADLAKLVQDSLPHAHFKPATLNGKPIALTSHMDVVVFPD